MDIFLISNLSVLWYKLVCLYGAYTACDWLLCRAVAKSEWNEMCADTAAGERKKKESEPARE